MSVAGLIFSNIHDSAVPEFTTVRTMASVPFGCRYRLIDFPLSNMVNSGITKIGIITHNNYQSLMDHIGTGKDWDLARRSGGIKVLPPFITAYEGATGSKLYTTRLEALMGVMNFISRCNEDYLVLSDCDGICNIDLSEVIDFHIEKNADLTVVTRRLSADEADIKDATAISAEEDGAVKDASAYLRGVSGNEVSTNIVVVSRMFLLGALRDAAAHGYKHFYKDIVARRIGRARIYRYMYEKTFVHINSLEGYFASSMKLLDPTVRNGLFNVENMPIYTKLRNSAPTRYTSSAKVTNSYVADGCVIEGTVENCILFRGVRIGKGTVVKNCVLLQDTFTGNNVSLNCVITDKNAVICDGRMLSGHSSMPFFIPKGAMV
ncbi:MAG: glucose-1-phosphate adenylyltransferase subunit GlgD [Clostridia bacterium]|nr:glucose-1-phosphate adenylyltransferase subunit GlgD [Clostridia bacterium]